MLIVALVLAVVSLAALVTAIVTGNELLAWVCIGASVLGVILLIVDAIRDRRNRDRAAVAAESGAGSLAAAPHTVDDTYQNFDADYPNDDQSPPDVDIESEPVVVLDEADPEPLTDLDTLADLEAARDPNTINDLDTVANLRVAEVMPEAEVRYVGSDATMEVRTAGEPDAGITYVTEDDATADIADIAKDRNPGFGSAAT
jgi:hypothetical protein